MMVDAGQKFFLHSNFKKYFFFICDLVAEQMCHTLDKQWARKISTYVKTFISKRWDFKFYCESCDYGILNELIAPEGRAKI